jgi:hypothetical protein
MVKQRHGFILLLVIGAACITACGSAAAVTYVKGEELAFYNFSDPTAFEQGAYRDATLRIVDGVYRIDVPEGDATLWWGQWGETYQDVIIEVDAEQITERNENAYGVMCRVRGTLGQPADADPTLAAIAAATIEPFGEPTSEVTAESTEAATAEMTDQPVTDAATPEATPEAAAESTDAPIALPTTTGSLIETDAQTASEAEATVDPRSLIEGDGYLFMVQGTGAGAIFRARGRDVQPLADWQTNDAIVIGPGSNRLRAICAGTTLSLYVNDVLIAQVSDDAYRAGQVGLVAGASNRLGVRVEFDNMQISAVGGN